MTQLSRTAQVAYLQKFLNTETIHMVVVSPAVAASLSNTSTVADVAAGELTGVGRVLINNHTGTPLTAAWNATNGRAEASVTVTIENTGVTDRSYGTFALIYGGSITSGNTTGTYYGKRQPFATAQTLPGETTQQVTVTLIGTSPAIT